LVGEDGVLGIGDSFMVDMEVRGGSEYGYEGEKEENGGLWHV
jgi:hypothetical protein